MRAGPISVGNVALGLVVVFMSVGVPDAGWGQGSNPGRGQEEGAVVARVLRPIGMVTNPPGTVAEL